MRLRRAGHAIGAMLIGLALLLAAPDSGVSQGIVRSGLSADKPLSYHLSALSSNSVFSRQGGIWVRHEGMWAFRPTLHFDWQAYFRCQAGQGCGGLGWTPHPFGSWLPFGFALTAAVLFSCAIQAAGKTITAPCTRDFAL